MNNQKIKSKDLLKSNILNKDKDYRIKIEEKEQRDLFNKLFKKFGNVKEATSFLGITNQSFSRCYGCATRYIPYKVIQKIVSHLGVKFPKILYQGNLKQIRLKYMKKSHPILAEKYGLNWAKELTVRRDKNKIDLYEFPEDTYVFIEDNFRKKLLEHAANLFGNQEKLMKKLGMNPSTLIAWNDGKQKDYKTNKVGVRYIPLKKIKEISKYLCEDNNFEFSMEEISKHTLMYRLPAGNPIKNIKLPIIESPELVRLLFHLLGDGYGGAKGETASYKNTCKELLEEVKKDLKIFGDVPVYEQEYSIKFPRIIADIIKNFYKVKLKTFDSFISDKIKGLPKKLLYHGIRAFADDESSAYPTYIRFSSANYNLIIGIRELVNKYLSIKTNPVKEQCSEKARYKKTYYFDLRDVKLYKNKIGFIHPKKAKIINEAVKKRRKKRIDN